MTAGEPEGPVSMLVGVYGAMSYMAMTQSGGSQSARSGRQRDAVSMEPERVRPVNRQRASLDYTLNLNSTALRTCATLRT